MIPWTFLGAAVALGVERACYVWISRAPDAFRMMCARAPVARLGGPVAVVRALFCGFKALQISVFVGWCLARGGSPGPAAREGLALVIGAGLVVVGQVLNWSVFYRLGTAGVFYGDRFGHEVPWCRDFPFSILAHPQYVGAVLSIWGFFLVTRFPHADWALLPGLETFYYAAGAYLEERRSPGRLPDVTGDDLQCRRDRRHVLGGPAHEGRRGVAGAPR